MDNVTLAQIAAIERNREPPESGLMCDLLWSDPQPFHGRTPSKRGVGMSFGPDITRRFLEQNGLCTTRERDGAACNHDAQRCSFGHTK